MAVFRQIQVTFWEDPFIESLDRQHVCFYLFLLTNSKTKQCGIYEISMRQLCKSYMIEESEAIKLLDFFVKAGKIKYSSATNEIAIKNWPKHNSSKSPLVKKCIENELRFVKNISLIRYLYDSDYIEESPDNMPSVLPVLPPVKQPNKIKATTEESKQMWETFWQTYNKKIGKPQCEKIFFGLSVEIQQKICVAVVPYVASTVLQELPPGSPFKPMRANPQTWLNAKRWTDEMPAIIAKSEETIKLGNIEVTAKEAKELFGDGKDVS